MRTLGKLFYSALVSITMCIATNAQALPFNADVRVTNLAGISLNPRVAASGGTLHLVWQEAVGGQEPYAVYYARSTDNGTSWESAKLISAGGPTAWPDVTAAGNVVNVVWNSDVNSGDVFIARSTNNGANFTAPTNLSNASGYSRAPRIWAHDANTVHLVYYDNRFSVSAAGQIAYHLSCDGGVTFSAVTNLSDSAGDIDDESPKLTTDAAGTPYVTFRSTREGVPQGGWPPFKAFVLKGRAVDCNSRQVSWLYPAQRVGGSVEDAPGTQYATAITRGASGRMHLAYWDTTTGGANVMYRRGAYTGGGWDAVQNLSGFATSNGAQFGVTAESSEPAIVEDAAGRVHAFYMANSSINQSFQVGSLFYRESTNGGVSFGATQTLVNSAMPPRAIVHNGRVHVFWADFRDNNTGAEIYHKFANEDGSTGQTGGDSDGDGIPNNVEASVGRNPNVKDNDIFTNNQLFVMQQFRDTLGREADGGGLGFWLGELNAGRQTRASMIEAFTTSGEFDTLTAPMARLYFGTYLRIPDYPGLAFWTDEYRSGRRTLVQIAEAFATAQEFINLYGANTDNTTYVNLLYSNIIGRQADAGGLNFWVAELNSGRQTRGSMLASFTESSEYKQRRRAEIFTTLMYAAMLRRAPDQAAFNDNVNQINAGASFQSRISGVLGSQEYRSRFLP
jgi:hypothetical protein